MPEESNYDVFLSYSHKDQPWVSQFVSSLSKAGVKPWFDKAELSLGDHWRDRIEEALRKSRVVVVLVSPNNIESRWTFFELGAAIADGKRIIPIVTQDMDLKKLPLLLRQYHFLTEPSPQEAARKVAEVVLRGSEEEIAQTASA